MRRLEIVTDDTDTTRGTEKGNDDAISDNADGAADGRWQRVTVGVLEEQADCSSRGEGAVSVPIYALTDEEIEAFLDGIQTAEQMAKMLHDRMTFMLEE